VTLSERSSARPFAPISLPFIGQVPGPAEWELAGPSSLGYGLSYGATLRQRLVYHDREFALCPSTARPSKKVKI
jgi:hypothetical protein